MSEPFLGEIRMMAFSFAPRGWALCGGQLLPINQNQALFALLGTMYGGNGQTTFALPDLRGRAPVHRSSAVSQGERAGSESHTLGVTELPAHAHTLFGSANQATTNMPGGNVLAQKPRGAPNVYGPTANTTLAPVSLGAATGGGGPHANMQPFLTVNFAIALQGIFPARS